MKSSKWIMAALTVVVVLAMATSSFAQVQLSVFNPPSAQEVQTSHNAQTADPTSPGSGILISGSLVASSTLTTTQLLLTFPAPITSSAAALDGTMGANNPATAVPVNDPITIQGASGLFASVTAIATVNYSAGTIVINLPGCGNGQTVDGCNGGTPATTSTSGSFRLTGVRIDANGKTGPLTLTTSLLSSANNYIGATQTPTLITSFGPGLTLTAGAAAGATPSTILLFTNNTTPIQNVATVVLTEGFASAWRTPAQTSVNGGVNPPSGNNIAVTLTGVPAGLTPSLSLGTGSSSSLTATLGGLTQSTTTAGTWTGVIQFTATSLTSVETLPLNVTLAGTATGTLATGNITLAATMAAPSGKTSSSGLTSGNVPSISGSDYPTFTAATTTITIGSIASATTVMLIPYVVNVGSYDTGIAIANTTADPFGAAAGGATPAAGTVTFQVYSKQLSGGTVAVTSSATNIFGSGFDTNGNVAAGTVWTGLFGGDILTAGKVTVPTTGIFGYVFITTNFVDAHGAAYVFNGTGFTSSTPVLILPTPQSNARKANEALNN